VGIISIFEWAVEEIESMLLYKRETLAKNGVMKEYLTSEEWLEKYNQWATGEEEGDRDE